MAKRRRLRRLTGIAGVLAGLNVAVARGESHPMAVDPVIEEPLRPLGSGAPGPSDCGAMNGFLLPLTALLTTGLGLLSPTRRRGADSGARQGGASFSTGP